MIDTFRSLEKDFDAKVLIQNEKALGNFGSMFHYIDYRRFVKYKGV